MAGLFCVPQWHVRIVEFRSGAELLNGGEDEARWNLRIRREVPILMSVAGALIAAATMEGFDT